MENASKALIIAGAILLAIVLVSLGVLVINNSRKDITDNNMDEAKVGTFNKNITQYCGLHKSAKEMNNLIRAIIASNSAQSKKADSHFIAYNTQYINAAAGTQADVTINRIKESLGIAADGTSTTAAPLSVFDFSNSYKYNALYITDTNGYIKKVFIMNDDNNHKTIPDGASQN